MSCLSFFLSFFFFFFFADHSMDWSNGFDLVCSVGPSRFDQVYLRNFLNHTLAYDNPVFMNDLSQVRGKTRE